eukprot:8442168-Alexandrium_andersonii.AAC.1
MRSLLTDAKRLGWTPIAVAITSRAAPSSTGAGSSTSAKATSSNAASAPPNPFVLADPAGDAMGSAAMPP